MLLEYLQENYKENEPIFLADIQLSVTNTNLRQMFKVLTDKGILQRYDTGIYYFKKSYAIKGGNSISPNEVAKCKYITKNNAIEGYYSGYTFANQLGLTTQVPFVLEIVTNKASANYREVLIKNQKIALRKPPTKIKKENYIVLQLLDLLKDIEKYIDIDSSSASKIIQDYIRQTGIKQQSLDTYIKYFPNKLYKNMYSLRLYNVFA